MTTPIQHWYIRPHGEKFDESVYDAYPNLFTMRFHHGGRFTDLPNRKYVEGEVTYVDMLDIDKFNINVIHSVLNCIGYDGNAITYFHYKIPLKGLDYALRTLSSVNDTCNMLKYVHKHKTMYVYVEHDHTTVETNSEQSFKKAAEVKEFDPNVDIVDVDDVRQFDGNEDDEVDNEDDEDDEVEYEDDESNTDDEQDSESQDKIEDIVDEDHIVDEVEVNMNGFSFQVDDDGEAEHNDHIIPEMTVTEEALEEIDFDSFESDVGDDEQAERRKGLRKLRKAAGASGIKNSFFVGKEFANRDVAKERIRAYSVECRRNIEFVKNDKLRIRVKCNGVVPTVNNKDSFLDKAKDSQQANIKGKEVVAVKGKEKVKGKGNIVNTLIEEDKIQCPWLLYIGKGDKGKWVVKTFKDEHKCLKSRKIKAATFTFLSKHCQDLIHMNPEIPVLAIQEHMQKKFHVGVSRTKAFRAKAKAQVQMRGDATVQYSLLRDYVIELQRCNPETTVKVDVYGEEDPDSPTRMFRRIYVCLGALKKGFQAGGRDLLGLDGAFMRKPYPGQLLTAVGVDANNGIYPVAYGIVESESQYSWTWFLKCLGDDLDLYSNSNFTFITDRQKGLLPAIAKLFPSAEHRFCVRHIHENMNLTWRGGEYKDMLWKCASALTVVEFDRAMEELKAYNKKAYEWLKKIPPQHWSRAHFSGRAHCDLLINNICEVFNRQLLQARDSPIISALEYVREYLMKRIVLVQNVILKSEGPLTPAITKIFTSIKEAATQYTVQWNGADQFQAKGPWGDQCVVNLEKKMCSCRKWEISGIPCKHAVACIYDMADNGTDVGTPEDWVHPSYKLQTWMDVYSHKINPVTSRQFWAKFDCPTTLIPPKSVPQIGRPCKKRKKSAGEIDMVKLVLNKEVKLLVNQA